MPEDGTVHAMRRNLIGFWLLGLTNNYAYVIMLSAATAILEDHDSGNSTVINGTTPEPPHNRSGHLLPYCNQIGTGAVLLADIIPTLIIKLTAPFFMHKIDYRVRVVLIVAFDAASFPIVSTSDATWLSLVGVVCASIGAGFGEITFLSLSSHFHKNVVSTWSSGTGAAGLFGSLSYVGLITLGVSPANTLLIMLFIPVVMFVSYFFLLVMPPTVRQSTTIRARREDDQVPIIDIEDELMASEDSIAGVNFTEELTVCERLALIRPLLKYMIPLGLVYVAEYFINQALFELVYFLGIWLSRENQYAWYQAIYQLGVFISRSSVNLFRIHWLWLLAVLQFANAAFLLCQIFFQFVPSIWIIFLVILFEGLLGGATYVNTFYKISEEVEPEYREFSMGVTSVSDSAGITIAGIIAVPVHNAICNL